MPSLDIFTRENLKFASVQDGSPIGSLYFESGNQAQRIRLVHSNGPTLDKTITDRVLFCSVDKGTLTELLEYVHRTERQGENRQIENLRNKVKELEMIKGEIEGHYFMECFPDTGDPQKYSFHASRGKIRTSILSDITQEHIDTIVETISDNPNNNAALIKVTQNMPDALKQLALPGSDFSLF